MTKRHRIKELMRANRVSRDELADRLGSHPVTVSKLISGPMNLTLDWIERLAAALGVLPHEILASSEPAPVPAVGRLGPGGRVEFEADAGPGPIAPTRSLTSKAVTVASDTLGAMFRGWWLIYDDERRPAGGDMVGRLCFVGLADGSVLVRMLRPAKDAGRFHLLSAAEEPELDVEVSWAAPIRGLVPP
jgi:DNA-binding Xre family transcriptional regulator